MILHSQIFGEGQPFLILHGFLGMSDNWKTLGRKFAEMGYQMHLVDQRNHGRSFRHTAFGYPEMSKDLLAYLDHHGLDRVQLLGHSMGGKTAMEFACDHPDRVHRLVVADIAPKAYPPHHQDILKALNSLDFDVLQSRSQADAVLQRYIPELGVRQFLLKNLYWVEKGKLGLRINLPVLTQKVDAVGQPLEASKRYEGPSLFVRGGNSGYVADLDELCIRHQFPNFQLQTIAGAGHWLHAEQPIEFQAVVKDFLK